MGAAAPAFGQTSQMGAAAPAFGQTSQIGAPQSAFGQTPSLGAAAPAFGQASTLGQKPNPFGSAPAGPSAFAQAGQGTFGQTGQTQSAFGQPSAMGQKANPFGASATTTQSPFGQPSAPAVANPFAQNGQAASSTTSAFGQPAAASTNPFGQPATTSADQAMDTSAPTPSAQNAPSNPFGQPATGSAFKPAAQNPFGAAPSSQPFRSTQNAPNPFGKPSAPAAAQPQPQTQARNGANSSPYAPGSTKTHPPVSSYIQFRPSPLGGKPLLTSFKNQQVVYKIKINNQFVSPNEKPPEADPRDYPLVPGYMQSDGSWCRIICPDGAPPYYEDTEPDVSAYHPGVKEKYVKMGLTGRFDGGMPEVPPMREDCNWVL
ncbi:hypothetical protein F5Y18DRAFT_83099 [Xylariaceae sp. FL1019]|nr:hypothetical protein F5Y18DRAFT_83099 [Xylariaceae sp. FL1019]